LKNNYNIYLGLLLLCFFGCSKKNEQNIITFSQKIVCLSFLLMIYLLPKKKIEYTQKSFDIVINNENDSLNRVNFLKLQIDTII
jgi:hypothetical protein